jgi:phosphoglycerate kinase
LPVDVTVTEKFKAHAPSHFVTTDQVGHDDMIVDVGPKTIALVEGLLAKSKTLVWNGPFGAFELPPFDEGTNAVAQTAARLTCEGQLLSVAGGGDTVAALNQAGVAQRFTYVSTAGGAFLEWLEQLPGVLALEQDRASA